MDRKIIQEHIVVYGEPVTLFIDDECYLCPVCGAWLSADSPYGDTAPCDPVTGAITGPWRPTPSQVLCSCCNTQFGFDDWPLRAGETLRSNWQALREIWLERVDYSEEAVRQLRDIGIVIPPKA